MIMNKKNGRFEKGDIPFNKGKKWNEWMSKEGQENVKKTQFKKGMPCCRRTRPLGTERLCKDGYVEVKVAKPNVWKQKQVYIYEQKYGEIPRGYVVIFLDGDKYNFDISNLSCISRRELLILNRRKLLKKDKELSQAGVNVAKLLSKAYKRGEVKND